MKKRVFFLLMAALMPLAMNAQQNASVHIDTTVNACVSYTWPINNMTYTTSGVQTAIVGDTLYILDLTINPVYNITLPTTVQGGCTFTWGDSVYTTSGFHSHLFQSADGCDSTVNITLALTTTATRSYTVTACGSYTWKGQEYTSTGIVNVTDTSNIYCDSILTLDLTIVAPEQKTYDTTISACERVRFRWSAASGYITAGNVNNYITIDGYTITSDEYSQSTASARAMFHPRTLDKCFDSTVTIHFNIKRNVITLITEQVCDSYSITINDEQHVYTSNATDSIYVDKAFNGCDSSVKLNLTINKTPEVYITGDLRVAPGSSATLNANSNQNVNYTWSTGSSAESITIPNIQGNVDVWLNGRNNSTGCEHTAYVTVMANAAIDEVINDMVNIYPNPTCAKININSAEPIKNVSIFSMAGQQVINAQNANNVDMSKLTNGAYVVRVEMQNGTVATRTVILSK